MPVFNPPRELNGIPLSDRSRWLLFGPIWMIMPMQRREVFFSTWLPHLLHAPPVYLGLDLAKPGSDTTAFHIVRGR